MKISVIMGVYNPRRDFLFQAVESVIHQTFQDWEMILYDDGSREEYRQTIREVGDMDPRIRLLRGERNRGLAYALNQCLKEASGEYIARMDADDRSKPERLEKMYRFLQDHREYQWVGCNAELIDSHGIWGLEERKERPGKRDFLPYSPYIHPSVVFRRSILEKINGYKVSLETRRCEDYELFMRLHARGCRGYNLQEPLFQYREDLKSCERRTFCSRWMEMKCRYQGFGRLGILKKGGWLYVAKPLVLGLIPSRWIFYIRKESRRRLWENERKKKGWNNIKKSWKRAVPCWVKRYRKQGEDWKPL